MTDIDNDRPRGVKVYPLPDEINGPHIFGTYALLIKDHDQVKVVHTEGVAYKVADDKPWRWTDYDPEVATYTPRDLIEQVDTSDENAVDLADWVRSFGARLESNFSQIFHWATSV